MASRRETWRWTDLLRSVSTNITAQELVHGERLEAAAGAAPLPSPERPVAKVHTLPVRPLALRGRPRAAGKFLEAGGEKLWVRGVTYGTFRPSSEGLLLPERETVARDFAAMAPARHQRRPRLHAAAAMVARRGAEARPARPHGLDVGTARRVPVEIAGGRGRSSRGCARAHALRGPRGGAGVAVGNEIPGADRPLARPARVERFLERLSEEVKAEDPGAPVTLRQLPDHRVPQASLPRLRRLQRLPRVAGDRLASATSRGSRTSRGERPLVMTEVGLDSIRHGRQRQAEALAGSCGTAFAAAARARSSSPGPTTGTAAAARYTTGTSGSRPRAASRSPRSAAVRRAFARRRRAAARLAAISVVVCTLQRQPHDPRCLEGLRRLDTRATR
jgi:O-antigen biosynthesis protein